MEEVKTCSNACSPAQEKLWRLQVGAAQRLQGAAVVPGWCWETMANTLLLEVQLTLQLRWEEMPRLAAPATARPAGSFGLLSLGADEQLWPKGL